MRIPTAIAAFGVAAMPANVSAQAWIGSMVGNMAAAAREAAMEKACRAGTPASTKTIEWATSSSDIAMKAYLALTSKSGDGAFRKVFAMKKPDVSWKAPDGVVPVTQLGQRLDQPKPTLKQIAFVVAGDGMTARGIWAASWDEQPSKTAYYAVDFSGGHNDIWGGGGFHIWHLTILPGDREPVLPAAYCHYDPDQAW